MIEKKHKVLALTRYQEFGASSRIRFYEYQDGLSQNGFDVLYSYLLPNEYVTSIYNTKAFSKVKLLSRYIKRFLFVLLNKNKFDIIWLEKELFPGLPFVFENLLLRGHPAVLADYDDSVHLNYSGKGFGKSKKIERIMRAANVVLAGSPYLKEVAEESGAKKVVRLPTPVYLKSLHPLKSDSILVGWIGSPATEKYLLERQSLFKELEANTKIQFVFMGVKNPIWKSFKNIRTEEWSIESENYWLNQLDLGIMPLANTLWEKGKCSYKILLYMSAGVPVVASPVGMNTEVIKDQENGYLAQADKEWVTALESYLSLSPAQKESMGQSSYDTVKSTYTYDKTTEILVSVFKSTLGEKQ